MSVKKSVEFCKVIKIMDIPLAELNAMCDKEGITNTMVKITITQSKPPKDKTDHNDIPFPIKDIEVSIDKPKKRVVIKKDIDTVDSELPPKKKSVKKDNVILNFD